MDGLSGLGGGRRGDEPGAHEPGERTEVLPAGPAALGPVVDTPTIDVSTGAAALRSKVESGEPLSTEERTAALRIGLSVPLEPGNAIVGQACSACGGRFGVGDMVVFGRAVGTEAVTAATAGLALVHKTDIGQSFEPGYIWRASALADREEELAAAGPEVLPAGTEPEVLLTPTEWEQRTGITIVNAHGWSHPWPNTDPFLPGLEPRPYEDPISEDEFLARAGHCTLADVNKLIEYAHGVPAPPQINTPPFGVEQHADPGDETDHHAVDLDTLRSHGLDTSFADIVAARRAAAAESEAPTEAEFYTTAEIESFFDGSGAVMDVAKLVRTTREAVHERDAAVVEYLEHHSPIFQSLVELAMVAGLAELDRQDKLVLRASANDVITLVIARGPHAGALAAWADDIITKGTN